MQKNVECIEIIFKGLVQGVFFRRAIKEYAAELNVFGFTKNLTDGSVVVVAIATSGDIRNNKELKNPFAIISLILEALVVFGIISAITFLL